MALTTYAELQTAIMAWIDRPDLSAVVPDFITLAESRMKRPLRVMITEKRAFETTTIGQETITLPDDFNGMRSLHIEAQTRIQLEQVSLQYLRIAYDEQTKGKPAKFAVADNAIFLGPLPDAEYQINMDYYEFPNLSDSNTTNAILDNHPDLYLYASLVEAHRYTMNEEGAAQAKQLAEQAMANVLSQDKKLRFGTSPLSTKIVSI